MTKKFKTGDWVFCRFELFQIEEMNGDFITQVTDGNFRTGGSNLNDICFPLTIKIKLLSELVEFYWKKIGGNIMIGLNYADIKQKYIDLWIELCEESDEKKSEILNNKLETLTNDMIYQITEIRGRTVENIKLF